jgi:hypothetical protein
LNVASGVSLTSALTFTGQRFFLRQHAIFGSRIFLHILRMLFGTQTMAPGPLMEAIMSAPYEWVVYDFFTSFLRFLYASTV